MNIRVVTEFAKQQSVCPVWRSFRDKWDHNTPRKGSKAFEVYAQEVQAMQDFNQKRLDAIKAEAEFYNIHAGCIDLD